MSAARPRILRRLASASAAALVAGTFLFGASVTLAASATKFTVCHHDRTLGTWSPIVVSTTGSTAHLSKGDYLADLRLVGKTVYLLAWTETDGLAGFSVCDQLNGAVYENSGDSEIGAGDAIVLGKVPTAFDAPYGFVGMGATSATVDSIRFCGGGAAGVNTTDGGAVVIDSFDFNGTEAFGFTPDLSDLSFGYDVQDGHGGGSLDVLQHGDASTESFRTVDTDDGFVNTINNTAC